MHLRAANGLQSPQVPVPTLLHAVIDTCSANFDPRPGNGRIPTDEMEMAAHLYIGIQAFFARHADLRRRPFFITGESYAGKYVPSIGTREPVWFVSWVAVIVRRRLLVGGYTAQV